MMFIRMYAREIHMIEPITQRIEIFFTIAGGCCSRFQGRRKPFLDETFMSSVVAVAVAVMGHEDVEESGVDCGDQGRVCVTMLVIVLMVITIIGVAVV